MPSWIERLNHYGARREAVFFLIGYDLIRSEIVPLSTAVESEIKFDLNGMTNFNAPLEDSSVEIIAKPMEYEQYRNAFIKVRDEFVLGNTFLVNLTFPTEIEVSAGLNDIFRRSGGKYKVYYPERFVCFSPETFVQIADNRIHSFPMKGTINAALPSAEKRLLDDEKEQAEHITVVDLIRNDLSSVASNVRVERYRYIERIIANGKEILQSSTHIVGDLAPDWHSRLGEILFRLLPAGSVTGAPKPETQRIIREAENYDRGFYTGIAGIYDGERLDSGVMIRFIEKDGQNYYFKSGGGVTIYSDCRTEYNELLEKIYVPLR